MNLGVCWNRHWWLGAALILFLALPAKVSYAGKEEARLELAGIWNLDAARSEDPQKKLDAAMQEMMPPRGGMGGMGRGGGGGFPGGDGRGGPPGGRGGMGGGGGEDRGARMEELKRSLEAPKILALVVLTGEVSIREDSKPISLVPTDGKKHGTVSNGISAEHKAEWSKGTLVYEVKTLAERSVKRTERYQVSSDGTELTVTIELDSPGRMPDVSIRRVYVRGEGEPAGDSPPVVDPQLKG